ncbi:hypothetical protein HYV49_04790 [Candidatus Pacearchaeota archaeon]|nr:hypothetical protein [Candidatus Pacearchaeota archaeon]
MSEFDEIFRRTTTLKEEDVPIKVNDRDVKVNVKLGVTSEPRDWYISITAPNPFRPITMPLNQFYRGKYEDFYNSFINCLKKGKYETICNERGELINLVFSV